MAFWVRENLPYSFAVVHRAECPHCQNGKAPDTAKRFVYEWAGPFHSYAAAAKAATKKGFDTSNCEECKPE